jgi:hypothetical protein
MRSIRVIFGVLTVACWFVVGTGAALAAPPSNDAIVNATPVTRVPFVDAISTVDATTAVDDPFCAGSGHTVWYTLTPKRDLTITANTFGSDYDTTLSAYVGSPGDLTQIACNDDANGLQSEVTLSVTRRQTVYFMVGSFFDSPGGALTFSITDGAPAKQPGAPVNSARNRAVSGPFAGSAFFEFSSHGCTFVYEQFDGSYTTKSGGTGTLHLAGCAVTADVPGGFQFVGSFVLATPEGVTLTGTAQGTVFPVDLTLTVTTSTARTGPLHNIAGTIHFSASGISGNVTGTLTGALRPARANGA